MTQQQRQGRAPSTTRRHVPTWWPGGSVRMAPPAGCAFLRRAPRGRSREPPCAWGIRRRPRTRHRVPADGHVRGGEAPGPFLWARGEGERHHAGVPEDRLANSKKGHTVKVSQRGALHERRWRRVMAATSPHIHHPSATDRRRRRPPSDADVGASPIRGASRRGSGPQQARASSRRLRRAALANLSETKQGPHLDETEDESNPWPELTLVLGVRKRRLLEDACSAQTTHEIMEPR